MQKKTLKVRPLFFKTSSYIDNLCDSTIFKKFPRWQRIRKAQIKRFKSQQCVPTAYQNSTNARVFGQSDVERITWFSWIRMLNPCKAFASLDFNRILDRRKLQSVKSQKKHTWWAFSDKVQVVQSNLLAHLPIDWFIWIKILKFCLVFVTWIQTVQKATCVLLSMRLQNGSSAVANRFRHR